MKRPGNSSFLARLKRVFVVATCLYSALAICFSSSVATALSDEMLDKFAANNIMFYDPDDKGDSCVGEPVNGNSITYIGDSISDGGAYANLKSAYTGLDGEDKEYDGSTYDLVQVSKRFAGNPSSDNYDGLTIAAKMVEKGDMRPYLIFALGTNDLGKNGTGSVSDSSLNELAEIVGDKTKVMLVSAYGLHETSNGFSHYNEQIKAFAASHSNFSVADWYTTALGDPTRYINDSDGLGVHLTSEGTSAFVDMLKNAISTNWVIGSSGGGGNGNKNYAGRQILSDEELALVEQNRPFYEAAAQPYGLPWQLIAAIHYREHNLSRSNPTTNHQGIYQLYSLWSAGVVDYTPGEYQDDEHFAEQTNLATEFLYGKIRNSQYDHYSDEGVKEALFMYNGAASQYKQKARDMGYSEEAANYGEGSPYVMNFYDAERDHTSGQVSPYWGGRYTDDNVYTPGATYDSRPGGFLVYQALGGGVGKACSNINTSGLVATVLKYAWPDKDHEPAVVPKDEYAARMASWGLYKGSCNGVDCGGWVTFLMIESGFEPDYNYAGHGSNIDGSQLEWVQNSENWELVNPDWDTEIPDESVLSPGDVAFSCPSTSHCGHTYAYVGEIEGFGSHIASASQCDRAPSAGGEAIFRRSDGQPIRWYHKVK